jgi:hypothetical protein
MGKDLFGNEIPPGNGHEDSSTKRPMVNDMKVITDVLTTATSEQGYVIAGRTRRVFRRVDKEAMKPIPAWESNAVHQLIDSGQLTLGGNHVLRCGAVRGSATSVLVPKATRAQLSRWGALAKPSNWD